MDTKLKIAYSMIRIMVNKSILDIKIHDIIYDAGISRSTFYQHFKNKKEIVNYLQNIFIKKTINAFNRQYRKIKPVKMTPHLLVELSIDSIVPVCYRLHDLIKIINYHDDLEYWNFNLRRRYSRLLRKTFKDMSNIQIDSIVNFFMVTLFMWNTQQLIMPLDTFQSSLKQLYFTKLKNLF